MKLKKHHMILAVPALIVTTALIVLLVKAASPEETIITGMAEATEIDVASKIPGRIDTVLVREGDVVTKGQLLAVLESKEVAAKVEQARGAMDAARARMSMAQRGARPEEKEAVKKLYEQATSQFELAQKTWKRVEKVYKDSLISTQERDQAEFQFKAARDQMDAAKAKYDMVMNGARPEEIDGARSLFHQAENAYNEAMAYNGETRIVSRTNGEITKRIVDAGEMAAAGYPIFTILDPTDIWITLQVREDQMGRIKKGMSMKGSVPALGNLTCEFEVTSIAAMGEYASWRPTRQKGEFDLKTFEIRLRPTSPLAGLRPGMSVNIAL
ncbi:MAG TPA: efflux RND transporter periplasmic adaptor subunit [Bacteroidota bacterium]|nr:efflux RND transporter periplasmic adaptor subunit [Bacteroidota bacterium]